MSDISAYRRMVDGLLAQRQLAVASVKQEREALEQARDARRAAEQALVLVQEVAQAVQVTAHKRIARIVTRCLRTMFDYDFAIEFRRLRGKTEARLALLRDGQPRSPLKSAGGGVVDLCSFALRLACLVLAQPQRRRLMVLDEPCKHLSRNHGPAFAELLTTLAKELKLQVLMVTHSEDLEVGKVVRL